MIATAEAVAIERCGVSESRRVEAPAKRAEEDSIPRKPSVSAVVRIPEPPWAVTIRTISGISLAVACAGSRSIVALREAASRVVFMDQGRIVETAGPDVFFTNPATDRARQFLARYGSDKARK